MCPRALTLPYNNSDNTCVMRNGMPVIRLVPISCSGVIDTNYKFEIIVKTRHRELRNAHAHLRFRTRVSRTPSLMFFVTEFGLLCLRSVRCTLCARAKLL